MMLKCDSAMLLVRSYEPVRGCVAARCGSSQNNHNFTLAHHRVSSSSVVRASALITEGRGFKSHLGLGSFFPKNSTWQNGLIVAKRSLTTIKVDLHVADVLSVSPSNYFVQGNLGSTG